MHANHTVVPVGETHSTASVHALLFLQLFQAWSADLLLLVGLLDTQLSLQFMSLESSNLHQC